MTHHGIDTPLVADYGDVSINTDGDYLQAGVPIGLPPITMTPGFSELIGGYTIPSVGVLNPVHAVDVKPFYDSSHPGTGWLFSIALHPTVIAWKLELQIVGQPGWMTLLEGDEEQAGLVNLYQFNWTNAKLVEFETLSGDTMANLLNVNIACTLRANADYIPGNPGPQYLLGDVFVVIKDMNIVVP